MQIPIEGIVCGFLHGDAIDHELLKHVLAAAAPRKVTFHRAFEELSDPLAALLELKRYPQIDTILTSGGKGEQQAKVACLDVCERVATPEITILAGGGMTEATMRSIRAHTRITAFHVGTMVREPLAFHGQVVAEKVRQVINSCLA